MSGRAAHEVGIVDYPGAQVACILGLTDLFSIACTIALDQRRSGQIAFRVTHWKPIDSFDANLSCVYDSAPRDSTQPRTLIIPPTMVNLPNPDVPAGVVESFLSGETDAEPPADLVVGQPAAEGPAHLGVDGAGGRMRMQQRADRVEEYRPHVRRNARHAQSASPLAAAAARLLGPGTTAFAGVGS